MLKNAFLHEDEIRRRLYEVWYDPYYQYYFCGAYHNTFSLHVQSPDDGDWSHRAFASVNTDGQVVGLINYCINHDVNLANRFGAINFTADALPFGRDVLMVIDEIFLKFGLNKIEANVVIGNPAEKNYDRLLPRYGGRIIGIRQETIRDMAGNLCDMKMYEIMREDYLRARQEAKK